MLWNIFFFVYIHYNNKNLHKVNAQIISAKSSYLMLTSFVQSC